MLSPGKFGTRIPGTNPYGPLVLERPRTG